jgi:hypothetical protein
VHKFRKRATRSVALAVAGLAVTAAVALAAVYTITDGSGGPIRSGAAAAFPENFQASGSVTLTAAGGAITNVCDLDLSGQVTSNTSAGPLKASVPGHVLSSCSSGLPSYPTGAWGLTITQAQAGPNSFKGTVTGVKSLVYLNAAGTSRCELRGTPKVTWNNGSPSTVTINSTVLNVFNGAGTQSLNCPIANGTITGLVTIDAASNPTNNLRVTI